MVAPAFLRYAPEDDQRPDPMCDAVLDRATEARLDEIRAWLKPRMPTLSDLEIKFALKSAMKVAGPDGFRASKTLFDLFKWPVDMALCLFVRDTCNALAFALRVETRVWAVRVGIRFPARSEHLIEWMDETGEQHAGKVISVDDTFAAGIVQKLEGGSKRIGQPRRVFAEHVVANVTKAEYAGVSTEPPPKFTKVVDEVEAMLTPESRYTGTEDCITCDGLGVLPLPDQDLLGRSCPDCGGSGKVEG